MRGARAQRIPVRLFNGAQRLLARVGRPPAGFADSEAHFLDAARRKVGSDDFGDPGFLDGLRVLLRAYDGEARLSPFGRMLAAQGISGVLEARLRVQRALQEDPLLTRQEIRRPLFVLGLPRTGTTALHQLLAQDPANQALDYWLAASPGPRPPAAQVPRDPRFRRALRDLRVTYWLDPGLRAIHDLSADGPDECRHLLMHCFTDDTFDSNASIPGYTKWLRRRDLRPSYAWHRKVLGLIGSPCPERRWVLKYPAHLGRLEVLLAAYPDACIVQTHRDPARVLPSLCSLVTRWRGIYEDEVDTHAVARWQVEMWAERMEHAIAVRGSRAAQQFFDLPFREIVADPIAAVKRVYAHFGFPWTAAAEARMRSWHEAHPPGRHGGHHYRAADFGLVPEEVAERFAAYRERFGVAREPEHEPED